MARGRAEVYERLAAARSDELVDVGHAGLKFQRTGYPIERFQTIAPRILLVLMQVYEPRSNDQAAGVDYPLTAKGFC